MYVFHPLSTRSKPGASDAASIDGFRVDVPNEAWLIDRLIEDAAAGRGGTVFTINLDHLAKLRRDEAFRAAYRRAGYVTADGMPVVMIARAEGLPIERVTGADLVEPLCRAAAAAGHSVYFFGARRDVLERAAEQLGRAVPDLRIAGIDAPPMGFDPLGPAAEAAARRIAASGAAFCFVALGAPKQELFADACIGWAPGVTALGVGAAFDFLAGERARAPRLLQRLGLEWSWRIAQEPRRLLPRYVRSAAWLAGYVLRRVTGVTRDVPLPRRPLPTPAPFPGDIGEGLR